MQKKLLGMAVATALAAPAAALAQVQVYGTAHVSFNSTKYSAGTDPTHTGTSKMAVNSHASNFGIRSSETLGGGLTGWVQYEFNVKMERDNDLTGANGSTRNTAIGLRGGFGNIFFGTWETPFSQTFRMWDVGTIGGYGPSTSTMYRRESTASAPSNNCGNSLLGQANITTSTVPTVICYHADGGPNGAYALWRRYGSAIHYESPMFGNIQFKLGYQPNETKSVAGIALGTTSKSTVAENPSSWSASIAWTGMGGNARAVFANMKAKDWTSIGNSDGGWIVGGGYNFGVANIGLAWEQYEYKGAANKVKTKEWGAGIAIPMGSGKIGASYSVANDPEDSVAGKIDAGAKMFNVGYEWALSKRTAVGFGISKITNDPVGVFTWTGMAPNQTGVTVGALAGSDPQNIFVSFRHSF